MYINLTVLFVLCLQHANAETITFYIRTFGCDFGNCLSLTLNNVCDIGEQNITSYPLYYQTTYAHCCQQNEMMDQSFSVNVNTTCYSIDYGLWLIKRLNLSNTNVIVDIGNGEFAITNNYIDIQHTEKHNLSIELHSNLSSSTIDYYLQPSIHDIFTVKNIHIVNHVVDSQNYYVKKWMTINSVLPYQGNNHTTCNMYVGYDESYSKDIVTIFGGVGDIKTGIYPVVMYDIMSQKASIVASLQDFSMTALSPHCYVTVKNKVYFLGDKWNDPNNMGVRVNFFVFNIEDYTYTQWGLDHPKPYETLNECYTSDGTRYVYLIGGYEVPIGQNSRLTNVFSIFDTDSNSWDVGPSLNVNRSGPCIYTVFDTMLYIFAGGTGVYGNAIEKYSKSLNRWEIVHASWTKFNYSMADNAAAYTTPGSNTIFIFGLNTCSIFNIQTEKLSEDGCLHTNILAIDFGGIYIPFLNSYYIFGGDAESSHGGACTQAVQYSVLCPVLTQIDLSLSSKTLLIGQNLTIVLPKPAECVHERYNFTLTYQNLNISYLVVQNTNECLICVKKFLSDLECSSCTIGLIFPTEDCIYDTKYNVCKITLEEADPSPNIQLVNHIEIIFEPFVNLSLSDTIISPGATIPITISTFELKKNTFYEFRLYSSSDALQVDNTLNIQTNDETIESCSIGTSGVKISCKEGISPSINYNYINNNNYVFNISIISLSNNAKNITIYPTNGITVTIRSCQPGYGMDHLNQAQCLLCPYNSFTLTAGVEPCHKCNSDSDGYVCKGGNDVVVKYNFWLSALNTSNKEFYPFINITGQDVLSSEFCPPGYCCQKYDGCNFLEEYNKSTSSFCAFGRNMSTPLCGQCQNGRSELAGTTNCGICNEANYPLLIFIFTFIMLPFVIYVSYFDSSPNASPNASPNDKSAIEISTYKTMIFDIGFYYYQALSIIFLSKG
eukprot:45010_1